MTPLYIFNNKLLLNNYGTLALDSSCCCCDISCMSGSGGSCTLSISNDGYTGTVDGCLYPSYFIARNIFINEPNTSYSWNDGWPGSYEYGSGKCLFFTRYFYTSRGHNICSSYEQQCCDRLVQLYRLWKIDCQNEQLIDVTDEAVTFDDITGYTQTSNGRFIRCYTSGPDGDYVLDDCDCCNAVNKDDPDTSPGKVAINCPP